MVAINSLRAGVLPADRQVREKIAEVAQRVLTARGLQRRRSSEVGCPWKLGLVFLGIWVWQVLGSGWRA